MNRIFDEKLKKYTEFYSQRNSLNFNNNFRFQSIYLQFGVDVAKSFSEIPCESQTLDLLRSSSIDS